MKYIKKNALIFSMIFVMAAGLTGCGNKVGDIELKEGTNAIYIDEDGAVTYGVGESFKSGDYDEEALEKYINEEVEDYNASDAASVDDAIQIDRFDVEDKVAYLVLKMATVYDFNEYIKDFNKEDTNFFAGKIRDRGDVKIKGDFVSLDKKKSLTESDIKKMGDSEILILNGQYSVQIDGDIKYISDNCQVNEDGMITTAKAEDDLSYIIY